jgi:translation initiation factor 2 beta subunit (eIF-2beta)/eIF-5
MNKVRALLGVEVTTDTRLDLLRNFIAEYEKICKVCKSLLQFTLLRDLQTVRASLKPTTSR